MDWNMCLMQMVMYRKTHWKRHKKSNTKPCVVPLSAFLWGKEATVDGTLDFLDNDGGQLIKLNPSPSLLNQNLISFTLLQKGIRRLSARNPQADNFNDRPFSISDDQMLLQAADRLKQYTFEVLRANQHLRTVGDTLFSVD